MPNSGIKFFGFFMFPMMIVGTLVLCFGQDSTNPWNLCVVAPMLLLGAVFFAIAMDIVNKEKHSPVDEAMFQKYMDNLGYKEVPETEFKVRLTGRYGNEATAIRYGGVYPLMDEDLDRKVPSRYGFYNVGATDMLLVNYTVKESYRLFKK